MNKINVENTYKAYPVWDRTVRFFHWINVLCIIGLVAVGLVILNSKALAVSTDGKILLKTVHAYIGYVFVLNLCWRIIWGFVGGRHARWSALLNFGVAYRQRLAGFLAAIRQGDMPVYLGHNPLAKLMVLLLYGLISVQAVTGLVLAGTDLYLPPFGHEIAEWVTAAGEDSSNIRPYSNVGVDQAAYDDMRAFRKPFISVHVYSFYCLLIAIVLHVTAVVYAELRERCGLVSAMFSGNKYFSERPLDLDD